MRMLGNPTLYFVEDQEGYTYWIVGPHGMGPAIWANPETMAQRAEAAKTLGIDVRRGQEIPAN